MHLRSVLRPKPQAVPTAAPRPAQNLDLDEKKELQRIIERIRPAETPPLYRRYCAKAEAAVTLPPRRKEYLIVDSGYNMIFCLDGLRERAAYDLGGARSLLDLLSVTAASTLRLIVVFDSYRVARAALAPTAAAIICRHLRRRMRAPASISKRSSARSAKIRRPRGDVKRPHQLSALRSGACCASPARAGRELEPDERPDRRRSAPSARGGPPRGRAGKRAARPRSNQIPTRRNRYETDHTRHDRHHRSAKRLRRYIQRVSVDGSKSACSTAPAGSMHALLRHSPCLCGQRGKLGLCFGGHWDGLYVTTKTAAKTRGLRADLGNPCACCSATTLISTNSHMAGQCYRPGDGTGMYEAMLEAKAQGKIRHIGITAHKIGVAGDIIASESL